MRAPVKKPASVVGVASPVGVGPGRNQITAADQAKALQADRQDLAGMAQAVPGERPDFGAAMEGYRVGGLDGVAKAYGPDWYEIPEYTRTQILRKMQEMSGLGTQPTPPSPASPAVQS